METLIDLEKYQNNLNKVKDDLPEEVVRILSSVEKTMTRNESKKVVLTVQNVVDRYMKDLNWLFSTI